MGMDPLSWIALAGVAVSAAGTGVSAHTSHKQAEATKDAAKDHKREQILLRSSLEEKEQKGNATKAADDARRRVMASNRPGYNPTQLTGSMGLPSGAGGYPQRTLIGA